MQSSKIGQEARRGSDERNQNAAPIERRLSDRSRVLRFGSAFPSSPSLLRALDDADELAFLGGKALGPLLAGGVEAGPHGVPLELIDAQDGRALAIALDDQR